MASNEPAHGSSQYSLAEIPLTGWHQILYKGSFTFHFGGIGCFLVSRPMPAMLLAYVWDERGMSKDETSSRHALIYPGCTPFTHWTAPCPLPLHPRPHRSLTPLSDFLLWCGHWGWTCRVAGCLQCWIQPSSVGAPFIVVLQHLWQFKVRSPIVKIPYVSHYNTSAKGWVIHDANWSKCFWQLMGMVPITALLSPWKKGMGSRKGEKEKGSSIWCTTLGARRSGASPAPTRYSHNLARPAEKKHCRGSAEGVPRQVCRW